MASSKDGILRLDAFLLLMLQTILRFEACGFAYWMAEGRHTMPSLAYQNHVQFSRHPCVTKSDLLRNVSVLRLFAIVPLVTWVREKMGLCCTEESQSPQAPGLAARPIRRLSTLQTLTLAWPGRSRLATTRPKQGVLHDPDPAGAFPAPGSASAPTGNLK